MDLVRPKHLMSIHQRYLKKQILNRNKINEIWLQNLWLSLGRNCRYFWEGSCSWKNTWKKVGSDNDFWFILHSNAIRSSELYRQFQQYKKTRDWKPILTYLIEQNNCHHNAKVKMVGFKDRYECTRCHKFIINNSKT